MKYAILIYETPENMALKEGPAAEAHWGEYLAYHQALDDASAYLGGQPLDEVATAQTVRVRDGKMSVQDGPFAETKEHLAGFMIIEAPDLDAALEWAARCPGASNGALEVRPVMVIDEEEASADETPQATHVLLLYDDESGADASPEEMGAVFEAYGAYSAALVEAGAMAGGEALHPSNTATTVRLRNGERMVQDGPYADTKEQLGGFYILHAATAKEAAEWAAKCPCASDGVVEVRPVVAPPTSIAG